MIIPNIVTIFHSAQTNMVSQDESYSTRRTKVSCKFTTSGKFLSQAVP